MPPLSNYEVIFANVVDPLVDDVTEALAKANKDKDQHSRRTYVRCVFAMVEASVHLYRNIALELSLMRLKMMKTDIDPQSVAKIVPLLEALPYLTNTGKPEYQPQRLSLRNQAAYVIRVLHGIGGDNDVKLFSDNMWDEFRKALGIRHRLTHPKTPDDLIVSEVDLETVSKSMQ